MLVFVYGTLMTGMPNHSKIRPFIRQVQPARTKGTLYHLPYGYPALIEGNSDVFGELITLDHSETALEILDRLEGFYGPGNKDNLYHRVSKPVWNDTGEQFTAYVYQWAKPAGIEQIGTLIKNGDWRHYQNSQGGC